MAQSSAQNDSFSKLVQVMELKQFNWKQLRTPVQLFEVNNNVYICSMYAISYSSILHFFLLKSSQENIECGFTDLCTVLFALKQICQSLPVSQDLIIAPT